MTRAEIKRLHEEYREAAKRLFPEVSVSPNVTPHLTETGAFIEVHVFVPKAEVMPEPEPIQVPAPSIPDDDIPF